MSALEHLLARCVRQGACLVWQGATSLAGYGQVRFGHELCYVHRVIYEAVRGSIPAGLELDHVYVKGCRSRACCEADHLEAVTSRENARRGVRSRRTHCIRGHLLTGANLLTSGLKRGWRQCRTCHNNQLKLYRRSA